MGQLQKFLDACEIAMDRLGLSITRREHYNRNNQPEQKAQISYFDVLTAREKDGSHKYKMAGDGESYFHRFDTRTLYTDKYNAKWVSTAGEREEYVFKYVGSSQLGQFAMLTDDGALAQSNPFIVESHRNLGTYNFASSDDILHVLMDICPWVKWGNTAADNSLSWTKHDRFAAMKEGLGLKIYKGLEQITRKIEVKWEEALPDFLNKNIGDASDNLFLASAGTDRIKGRAGTDTVSYENSDRAVTVSLERDGPDETQGFDGWARGDKLESIENLVGSDFGDILIGNQRKNKLEGGLGRDILSGRDGNDRLIGGAGIDTIYGNGGNDTVILSDDDDLIYGGKGFDTVISPLQTLYISNLTTRGVDLFKLAETSAAKSLIGTNNPESLAGNEFDNSLTALGGADILSGEGGNDGLSGGAGNDTYTFHGNWGIDFIYDSEGVDVINIEDRNLDDLRIVRDIGVNSGFLRIFDDQTNSQIHAQGHFNTTTLRMEKLVTLDGTLNLRKGLPFTGTDLVDPMSGTAFNDLIDVKGGDDNVYAGDGDDLIIGGTGDDFLWGQGGDDTFIFEPGFGHDVISEAGRYPGEIDSDGDTIEMNGFAPGSVRAEVDFQGRMTISVLDASGNVSDSIFIYAQTSNYGSGSLVERIQFDGGTKMALTEFEATILA